MKVLLTTRYLRMDTLYTNILSSCYRAGMTCAVISTGLFQNRKNAYYSTDAPQPA